MYIMEYLIFKMTFPNGIHIGKDAVSDACSTIYADTVFSAMCIEALNIGGEDKLNSFVDMAKNDRVIISDALPYIEDTLYVPKPMVRIVRTDDSSALKKEFKKLSYIPINYIDTYLKGNAEPVKLNDDFSSLGKAELYQKAALKLDEDNELYTVGVYHFSKNSGLYIIAGFENNDDEAKELLTDIFNSLQYSGIGGKRTSGLGRFVCEEMAVPKEIKTMLDSKNSSRYMSLSISMAADSEIGAAVDGAMYKLIKRSGFVYSESYADTFLKKRDFYMFGAGSVFNNHFSGDIFDVSLGGKHPVYKYGKPIMLGL